MPKRDPSGSFLMAVDHCFSIRGQGTVMTGTILSGSINVNDSVEIPSLKLPVQRKADLFKGSDINLESWLQNVKRFLSVTGKMVILQNAAL
eukprot:g34575.t1